MVVQRKRAEGARMWVEGGGILPGGRCRACSCIQPRTAPLSNSSGLLARRLGLVDTLDSDQRRVDLAHPESAVR